jgi:acyl-CoA reductase-like NAD-dependent aldehyde dehydrogenase
MCGNTLVAKPSEITPTTASMLAEVLTASKKKLSKDCFRQ